MIALNLQGFWTLKLVASVSVGVAREDDRDGGASAKLNGLEQVGEDWVGHGGKVVPHVNDQER